MVNWAKKIHKHSGSELYAGEQVEAGTVVQPVGTLGRQVGFGVGGVVGAIAAEKFGANGEGATPDGGGLATQFPSAQSVLGVSAQRLMAFAHGPMSGKPKEMLTQLPLDHVVGMTVDKKKMSYALTIDFADGSSVSYEAVKMAKPVEFVQAFERLRA
ncbi:MAG: hypothetical protein QNJ77_06025 [Acidimicrobiia bacterium]|nr:hypothetical protein [Acidimicrobiia bacterium]